MSAANRNETAMTLPSEREITITRVFNAPRKLVFDAWTQPEHIRRWYGCEASTLIACAIDLRPGGAWRYALRMPDGGLFTMSGVYRDIVVPERLVYTERFNNNPARESLVAVTFDERQGRTTLTSTALFSSAAERDAVLAAGVEAGAEMALGRLAALVVAMARDEAMPAAPASAA
jgi:uncharacterized protein YndB with AHSA1/START domain